MVIIELKHYFTGGVMTELYSGPHATGDVMVFQTRADARDELIYKGYTRLKMGEYDIIGIQDKNNVFHYIDNTNKSVTFDTTLGILKETVAIIRNLKLGGVK